MRPKPFKPEVWNGDDRYIRDKTSGLVWHRCVYRTLYADTDRSKVVYHANYLRYFEWGRASLMHDGGYPYRKIEEDGFIYPIIELGISFFKPLFYDDSMYVHTRPAQMQRVRIQFDYVITFGETNEIVCKGFTRHCSLNSAGIPVAVDARTVHLWKTFPA